MAIGTVEMSVLVSESEAGVIKFSFRSKPPKERGGHFVDCNAFAARWGGGGHVHAAGARTKATMAEAIERLHREIETLAQA